MGMGSSRRSSACVGSGLDRGAIASVHHLVNIEHKPTYFYYSALLPWSVAVGRPKKHRKPLAAVIFSNKKKRLRPNLGWRIYLLTWTWCRHPIKRGGLGRYRKKTPPAVENFAWLPVGLI